MKPTVRVLFTLVFCLLLLGGGYMAFQTLSQKTAIVPVSQEEMPKDQELVALADQAVRSFAEASSQGNFEKFYGGLAADWKKETDPEKLKLAYKTFLDQNIMLSFVRDMSITLTTQPEFTAETQVMRIKGGYPGKVNVLFTLDFVHEKSGWKLFGLQVELL